MKKYIWKLVGIVLALCMTLSLPVGVMAAGNEEAPAPVVTEEQTLPAQDAPAEEDALLPGQDLPESTEEPPLPAQDMPGEAEEPPVASIAEDEAQPEDTEQAGESALIEDAVAIDEPQIVPFGAGSIVPMALIGTDTIELNNLTPGDLRTQINTDLGLSGATVPSDYAQITKLVLTGASDLDVTDRGFIQTNLLNLEALDLSGVTGSLSSHMFDGCVTIERVALPAGTVVESSMFVGCSSLRAVNVGSLPEVGSNLVDLRNVGGFSNLGGAFGQCTSIERVALPALHVPTYGMFAGCTSLTAVRVDEVPEVGQNLVDLRGINTASATAMHSVFSGCASIQNVALPSDVTVATGMFEYCSNLSTVAFFGNSTPTFMGGNDFFSVAANGTLYFSNSGPALTVAAAGLPALWTATPTDYTPVFSPQPVNVDTAAGTNASFTISASADPAVVGYQWQVSTDGGTSWTELPGETGAMLNLLNVSDSQHGNMYRCGAYDLFHRNDRTYSNAATLGVLCNVTVLAGPGGTVSGGGVIRKGDPCTLVATPDAGYTFTGWTLGGAQVSTSASYTFNVNASGTYTANFKSIYTMRTITDSATGVSATGLFTNDATLAVQRNGLHAAGTCAACDVIRAAGQNAVYFMDYNIALGAGQHSGAINLDIPVDSAYNGQSIRLMLCDGNVLNEQTLTVSGGIASTSVTALSPLAVVVEQRNSGSNGSNGGNGSNAGNGSGSEPQTSTGTNEKAQTTQSPQTGDTSNIWLWILLAGIALIACLAGCFKLRARRTR